MDARKQILAYGGSLRWGTVPATRQHHKYINRPHQILAAETGDKDLITTKHLPGLTSVREDVFRNGQNRYSSFLPIIEFHAPDDPVVNMFGVNDLPITDKTGKIR